MAMLGVLTMTNEYSSGMVRSTLTVVPSRGPAYAAKALVLGGFVFLTSAVAELLGALIAMGSITSRVDFDLFRASGLRVWLGGCLVIALMALLGLGLGTIFRGTGLSITMYFCLMLVLPVVLAWGMAATGYSGDGWLLAHMPALTPFGVYTPMFDETSPYSWTMPITTMGAIAATLFWTLGVLGLGALAFQRRDSQ
jgi:ABC-2 type transport system permease protein